MQAFYDLFYNLDTLESTLQELFWIYFEEHGNVKYKEYVAIKKFYHESTPPNIITSLGSVSPWWKTQLDLTTLMLFHIKPKGSATEIGFGDARNMAVLNRIFCLNTIDGYEIQPELVSWVKKNEKYLWAPGTHIYSHIPPRGLNVPCVGLENSDFNKRNFPDSDLYLTAATPKMLSQVVGKLVPGKKLLVYSCKGAELEDTIPHLPLTYLARVYIENGIDSVYLFEKI